MKETVRGLTLALCLIALFASTVAEADRLSDAEVFNRCYARLVRKVPSKSHPLSIEVSNKRMTAEAACVALFDAAKFTSGGVLEKRTDADAKAIVKTLNDLHVSWFQSKTYTLASGADLLLRDSDEPALYFTRAAFLPSAKFSSVVTHTTGLRGVRDQANYPTEIPDIQAQGFFNCAPTTTPPDGSPGIPVTCFVGNNMSVAYNVTTYNSTTKRFTATGTRGAVMVPSVQLGAIVGVEAAQEVVLPSFLPITPGSNVDYVASVLANFNNFKANRHFGGGVIGSQSFLLANANLGRRQLPLDFTLINRRLTSRVFEDLLCHQLPTLGDVDVESEVKPASTYMFQTQSTCMRCHSTIDGLGTVYRNFFSFETASDNRFVHEGVPFSGMAKLEPITGATLWHLQQPVGTLHYRENLTGRRVQEPVSSLEMIGAKLAGGNDLYLCAAKRYYKFFTGVDVDLTQPAKAELDLYHQNLVVNLGKTLKDKQSVREVLKGIFASEPFRTRNYLTERSK